MSTGQIHHEDDLPRHIGDMMRLGTIAAVTGARCTVKLGDVISPPVPWFARAGAFTTWCPPSTGEQVLLLCPEADINHGLALVGLYSDANPPPGDGNTVVAQFPDGSTLVYDNDAGIMRLSLVGGLDILVANGMTVTGDLVVDGKISATDNITTTANVVASGEVTGNGKHLSTHTHGGVRAGTDTSGAPS